MWAGVSNRCVLIDLFVVGRFAVAPLLRIFCGLEGGIVS